MSDTTTRNFLKEVSSHEDLFPFIGECIATTFPEIKSSRSLSVAVVSDNMVKSTRKSRVKTSGGKTSMFHGQVTGFSFATGSSTSSTSESVRPQMKSVNANSFEIDEVDTTAISSVLDPIFRAILKISFLYESVDEFRDDTDNEMVPELDMVALKESVDPAKKKYVPSAVGVFGEIYSNSVETANSSNLIAKNFESAIDNLKTIITKTTGSDIVVNKPPDENFVHKSQNQNPKNALVLNIEEEDMASPQSSQDLQSASPLVDLIGRRRGKPARKRKKRNQPDDEPTTLSMYFGGDESTQASLSKFKHNEKVDFDPPGGWIMGLCNLGLNVMKMIYTL